MYRFKVSCVFPFPFDMLRHDRCWPRTPEDAEAMETLTGPNAGIKTITFLSAVQPAPKRWESFGAHCFEIEYV